MENDTHHSEYFQMALQNNIQEDPELERDVQPPRSAKNDEILNFRRVFFATSGQMGHFRSKPCTYSKSPDCGLKIMLAEISNFSFYEDSISGP